ncbi:MAG: retention module-containing protein [Gammaproteobacteria bacterium]|nr:retention module-containing protein [Gammaproteobacteria bacterium]
MNTFTIPNDAQVVNINGNAEVAGSDSSNLLNGDHVKAGEQVLLEQGTVVTLMNADGVEQVISNEAIEQPSEFDALQAAIAEGDDSTDELSDILSDIDAIQALIESGDDISDLPATAAGETGNEGLGYITLDRSGAETLAESGYDTQGLAAASRATLLDDVTGISGLNVDIVAPTLEISYSTPDSSQNDQSTITFEFSEDVSNFTIADVIVTGGTLSDFTQVDGGTWTATFTPNPGEQTSPEIIVLDNSYTDLSGNNGSGDSVIITLIDGPTQTQSDTVAVAEDTTASGNVLDNDSDLDDDLTVASFTVGTDSTAHTPGTAIDVEGGQLQINTDGSYTFTPATNWNGTLPVITYTTNTGSSDTLTITINAAATATITLDANVTTDDIIDAAESGQTIAITGTVGGDVASGDTVTLTVNGKTFTGTVNSDNTTFSVNVPGSDLVADSDNTIDASVTTSTGDLNGEVTATDTEGYVVIPTVTVPNDGTGVADSDISVAENARFQSYFSITAPDGLDSIIVGGQEISKSQLENASTTPIVITSVLGVLKIVGFDSDTGTVQYGYDTIGPSVDHSGGDVVDSFTLVVKDVDGDVDDSSTSLDILITDTSPTAIADTRTVGEDETDITGNVMTGVNASVDIQSADEMFVTGVTAGTVTSNGGVYAEVIGNVSTQITGDYGVLTISNTGEYTYTPTANAQTLGEGETAADTFSYTIKDSDGDYSTTTVNFTVTGAEDAPTSQELAVSTNEDEAYYFTGDDFNFADVDAGDSLEMIKITELASNGTLEILVGGTWIGVSVGQEISLSQLTPDNTGETQLRFVPDADEASSGSNDVYASFTYQVSDGEAYSVDTLGNIHVEAVADAPNIAIEVTNQVMSNGLTITTWQNQNIRNDNDNSNTLFGNGSGVDPEILQTSVDLLTISDGVTSTVTNINDTSVVAGEANHATGLIYLEAGTSYTFDMHGDDSYRLLIGENFELSSTWGSSQSNGVTDTFTPSTSGYYTFDLYQHNQSGPGSFRIDISVNNGPSELLSSTNALLFTSEQALTDAGLVLTEHLDADENGYYQAQIFNEGDLDTDIILSQVIKSLNDQDLSEVLSLSVAGVPIGMLISDGTNSIISTGQDIDITGWNSTTLIINSNGANISDSTFKLTFTATATELSNNDQAQSSVELDVILLTSASGDTNTVNESDIDASNPVIVNGNIFENDVLAPNSSFLSISGSNVQSTSTDIGGNITVITTDGNVLTVDALGNYTYTLSNAVNHVDGNANNEFIDSFQYVVDSNGTQVTADLNISIVDDTPTAATISQAVTFDNSTFSSNLTFIVDGSGSMTDTDMTATTNAINALIAQYQAFSDVTINIVLFKSGNAITTQWIPGESDWASIITLTHGGGTDIAVGLDGVIASYTSAPDADQNVAYFFGDGDHNVNNSNLTTAIANWTNFLAGSNGETPIDALFSYSMNTTSVMGDINAVADSATDSVHRDAVNVSNVVDLTDAVLNDIVYADNGNLFEETDVTNQIDFGADGGRIESIEIGGVIVNYDSNNPIQNIAGASGVYAINFDTGNYTYTLNIETSNFVAHTDELHVVVIDNDGDLADVTFNHSVDFASIAEISQTITSISEAHAAENTDFEFNVLLNGIASTSENYNLSLNIDGSLVTLSSLSVSFSDGVILNSNGTITVPVGVHSFTVTALGIAVGEQLSLTIYNSENTVTANGIVDEPQNITESNITYDITQGAADDSIDSDYIHGSAQISTGAGNDHIESSYIYGSAQVSMGTGDDSIESDYIYGSAQISTGAGNDHIESSRIYGNAQVSMGTGDDTIVVNNYITNNVIIDTGAGMDTITIGDDLKGNVTIATGLGNDEIKVGDDILGNVAVDTGDGDDIITIGITGSGELRDSAIIRMGAGDDTLQLNKITGSNNQNGQNVDIDLGTGDDELIITGKTVKTNQVIELGDGEDTLTLSGMQSSWFTGENNGSSTVTVDALGVPTITFTHGNNISFTVHSAEFIKFGEGTTQQTYEFNKDLTNPQYTLISGSSTATVIDGIIAGLEYTTSSGVSGLTTDQGTFEFNPGDVVTFNIGNVVIGDIDMSQITDGQVFLQDIAATNRSDMTSQYVENMAVLLQSLDNNGDAYDGIVITESIRAAFSDNDFDLASISEQQLQAIIFEETGSEAITDDAAMVHVADMLQEYAGITVDSTDSEIFDWLSDDVLASDAPIDHVLAEQQDSEYDLGNLLTDTDAHVLEQYLDLNFDTPEESQEGVDIIQSVTLDGIDISSYAAKGGDSVKGILNPSDDTLTLSPVADDSSIGLHDDLSNGYND